ncbi:unnamed protein product [Candida verbasci]|uniref:Palmitoyltransferase n=1 Tax=Candida verbasci TaxID=1227364 RepID=A0A9W4XC84_9ASCO|nr:unnamed protein product [Candida verbasci]
MIWVSYFMAIMKSPGTSPSNYKPSSGQWKRYCKKCNKYKPPRTHHCKSCNQCILYMDHHCPWTMNCVGFENLPNFMRFLGWVIWGTSYLFIQLVKRIISYYQQSDLPIYLIRKSEMIGVIFFTPLDLFVLISISLLFIRCFINICKGMTQIEIWEWERIDNQFYSNRFWYQIRSNYRKLHNKELPELTTWTNNTIELDNMDNNEEEEQEEQEESNNLVPKNFTIDDIIFPYDLGIWSNIIQALNYPWVWLWPFSKPLNNGISPKISQDYKEDDQLNLPWPPDGNNQEEISVNALNDDELRNIKNYKELRKRLDPKSDLKRNDWTNDYGENLNDFGVDIDADDDNYELVTRSI